MKIGIPRALLYYRYGVLWETFFPGTRYGNGVKPALPIKIF